MTTLLEVEDLHVALPGPRGPVTVVDRVSFAIGEGEVFGVAGESGSGKTMTALALLGLTPSNALVTGRALLAGQDLLRMPQHDLRQARGRQMAMVFQDPMTSLHPMLTIERQLTEHVRYHLGVSTKDARRRAVELLTQVRIPDPASALRAYPHQFSGGMRQRIAIAIALACEPKLLIADEPTTALDVTVQAGILRLLDGLRRSEGLSVILITHDLGVMSSLADWLTVMYAGRVAESGPISALLQRPRHPYTRGLLDSLPHPEATEDEPLKPIAGMPPSLQALPGGCAFHPRCAFAVERCRTNAPALLQVEPGHRLACPVDPFAQEEASA